MDVLLGVILCVYSAATFAVVRLGVFQARTGRSDGFLRELSLPRGNAARVATVVAGIVVVGMWWFQYQHRIRYSREALARDMFEEVIRQWESGDRARATQTLSALASSEFPWRQRAEDSLGPDD